jgi:DNA-binding NarL/FixJ family response regulator
MDYLHYKASEALTLKIETEQKIKEAVKKAIKETEEKVRKETEEKVRKETEEKMRKETEERAINAIKKGLDNQTIAELTGLSVEQIEKLRKELE